MQQKLDELPSDESTEALKADLAKAKKEHSRMAFMLERMHKDKAIGIKLLNQTITDLQKHQKLLEESNRLLSEQNKIVEKQSEELAQSLRELEHFSYIASHDLQTPLRTIVSYAEIIQKRYTAELDDDGNTFLEYLMTGALQMNGIIEALLEYSRIGRGEQNLVPTDLNNILEHVRYDLRKELQTRKVSLKSASLPTVMAAKNTMRPLFLHLLETIILNFSETDAVIVTEVKKQEHTFLFYIFEQLHGLPDSFPTHLIEPGSGRQSGQFPGEGIGMAVCRKIILQHKGNIWVEKQEGRGKVIAFTIAC
ncbi:MAG: ATP-binding protein [Saprospiraceae bacterium]|nr:ATP-binding protein [Saprospiraceae bacterium]